MPLFASSSFSDMSDSLGSCEDVDFSHDYVLYTFNDNPNKVIYFQFGYYEHNSNGLYLDNIEVSYISTNGGLSWSLNGMDSFTTLFYSSLGNKDFVATTIDILDSDGVVYFPAGTGDSIPPLSAPVVGDLTEFTTLVVSSMRVIATTACLVLSLIISVTLFQRLWKFLSR